MTREGTTLATDEDLISEPITPDAGTFDVDAMATGLAGLPQAFTWRNRHYHIAECLHTEKRSSPEGGVSTNEVYLRRQVFRVRLDSGQTATLYMERQARRGASARAARQRWFLYSLQPSQTDPER